MYTSTTRRQCNTSWLITSTVYLNVSFFFFLLFPLIPKPLHWRITWTIGTPRPLLRPARAGDSESAVRRSAQVHPSSRHCVWIWQRRLAAHPSGPSRGRTGTHKWTDRRDVQIFLWVLLLLFHVVRRVTAG